MRDSTNDAQIKEIRDEFTDATSEWEPIRKERQTDMKYVAGDPWESKDRAAREEAKRPIITADELGQYVNQIINDSRQNKRAIRVTPEAFGADADTAEFRAGRIRQIEYKSNAQQAAYTTMFENAVQGSYGFLRVNAKYENPRSIYQELRIDQIPNPDLCTPDPYGLMPDGSDWKFFYLQEAWKRADFQRRWPKARIRDFSQEELAAASSWLRGDRIMVAERWRITTRQRRLLAFVVPGQPAPGQDPAQPPSPQIVTFFEDEKDGLAKLPQTAQFLKDRPVEYPVVTQQITNGIEILDETAWPGTMIPFVSCYGKVLFADLGQGTKRHILSAVRLARSPFMLYCYYRTQQAEIASMIPKVPIGGYKGQFTGREDEWQKAPHEPLAFLEFDFKTEGWNESWGPMPPPSRIQVSQADHLQALELCAEGARRAIQAAMGISPLPTPAQRQNQKSGVALQQIEESGQRGSFHFFDHYNAAIARTGVILDELIEHYDDTAKMVTVRKPDDTAIQVRINDPSAAKPVDATKGLHDVTITVGPYEASERDAASAFADTILGSELMKLLDPPSARKIAALAVKLKSVGPMGDAIAEALDPQKQDGTASPQQLAQLQGQVQQLQGELQKAVQVIQTKQVEQQGDIQQAAIKAKADLAIAHVNNAAKVLVARITAAKEASNIAQEAEEERLATGLEQAHEAQQAELDRQHEAAITAMGHAAAADQQDQAHANALEQGDAAAGNAMATAEHAQAIAPPEPSA